MTKWGSSVNWLAADLKTGIRSPVFSSLPHPERQCLFHSVLFKVSITLRPTVSRLVCLGIKHASVAYDQVFIAVRQLRICWWGRSLWREGWSAVYSFRWSSSAQSFSGPSAAGLVTIFYCLRFETPLTWRARHWVPFSSPPATRRAPPASTRGGWASHSLGTGELTGIV
jgi:hypothetical protein